MLSVVDSRHPWQSYRPFLLVVYNEVPHNRRCRLIEAGEQTTLTSAFHFVYCGMQHNRPFCSTTSSPTGPRCRESCNHEQEDTVSDRTRCGDALGRFVRTLAFHVYGSPLPHSPEAAQGPKNLRHAGAPLSAALAWKAHLLQLAAAGPAINSRILVPSRRDEGTCTQHGARRVPGAGYASTLLRGCVGAEASAINEFT